MKCDKNSTEYTEV